MSEIEPGYYWARWKASRHGKPGWHPVEKLDTCVFQIGSEVSTKPDDWEFGPRLEPPED